MISCVVLIFYCEDKDFTHAAFWRRENGPDEPYKKAKEDGWGSPQASRPASRYLVCGSSTLTTLTLWLVILVVSRRRVPR